MRRTGIVLRILVGLAFIFSALAMLSDVEAIAADLQLKTWFLVLVTIVKLAGGLGLLASLRFNRLALASGPLFVAIMAGALVTHIRIDDPLTAMAGPFVLLLLSAAISAIAFWEDLELRDSLANRIAVPPHYSERRQTSV